MNILKGTGVAMVTPFSANGQIDYLALARLIEHLIGNGVDYLVSLGTTGEAATLSKTERFDIFNFTIQTVKGRVPIVAGFGGNNTHQLLVDIQDFHFEGISAILSASPAYNKPNQRGIYAHYKAIAERSPVPIILYNVPGRTSSNMSAKTTMQLAQDFDNIVAVKEASGSFDQCMQLVQMRNEKCPDFLVLSGDDAYTLPLISCGLDGVISVVGNAFPKEFSDMVRAARSGRFAEAQHLHYQLLNIIHLLFADGNPAGVKAALHILGICENELRLPLVRANQQVYIQLQAAIQKMLEMHGVWFV